MQQGTLEGRPILDVDGCPADGYLDVPGRSRVCLDAATVFQGRVTQAEGTVW